MPLRTNIYFIIHQRKKDLGSSIQKYYLLHHHQIDCSAKEYDTSASLLQPR